MTGKKISDQDIEKNLEALEEQDSQTKHSRTKTESALPSAEDIANFTDRLKNARLGSGLDQDPAQAQEEQNRANSMTALVRGMRIGLEFVGGIIVGIVIGMFLDNWADTAPLFLIIFLLLGFAASMLNIYRFVNNIPPTIGVNRTAFHGHESTKSSENATLKSHNSSEE